MGIKIKVYGESIETAIRYPAFHCPGCGCDHSISVGRGSPHTWDWNGSFESPTFSPSILCNKDFPDSRCHSFVKDGQIQFLTDCWHHLAGQTVPLPDWED